MSRIMKYSQGEKRFMAVIHMPGSTNELVSAYSLMGIPHILYEGEDPALEEKFSRDSERICGISIGGGRGEYFSPRELLVPSLILDFPSPKIGICLGHEILGEHLGGTLIECNPPVGEYGEVIAKLHPNLLFEGLDLSQKHPVRMYHHQMLESAPDGAEVIAETRLTPVAGFYHPKTETWGLQFHPEKDWISNLILKNFYLYCQ